MTDAQIALAWFSTLAVLASTVVLVGFVRARKRRAAVSTFAADRGWHYAERDDRLAVRFEGPPFGIGEQRSARNVVSGIHQGRAFVTFDYRFTVRRKKSRTTHHHSVLAVNLGAVLPELSVQPENMVGRFFGRVFNYDIELESEQFNRAFTTQAGNRKFAFDVLHPQMMEMLLHRPDLGWRFERDSMLVIRLGRHPVEEIDAQLLAGDAIIDRIPEFVWQQVRGAGPHPMRSTYR